MASFLKEKNLISILTLCFIAGFIFVEGKGTLRGDNIVFSPLRRGSNYTLEKSKKDWFLASYDAIAEAVVLSLNSSPPYGKVSFNHNDRTGNEFLALNLSFPFFHWIP